jgi:hypothetical protein
MSRYNEDKSSCLIVLFYLEVGIQGSYLGSHIAEEYYVYPTKLGISYF